MSVLLVLTIAFFFLKGLKPPLDAFSHFVGSRDSSKFSIRRIMSLSSIA